MKFDNSHILVNSKYSTKEDLFKHLDVMAFEKKIAKEKGIVEKGFSKRENEGTTGFEDGFAIPHARIEGVKEPAIFIIRNEDKIGNWNALDGNGVQYAIALMIPLKSGSYHIDVLSTISMKLIDENFRNLLKTGTKKQIEKAFNELLVEIKNKTSMSNNNVEVKKGEEFLVGISKCPAGIAHTFMVKQKMENLAEEKNIAIKWETQGANGQKNVLSESDIDKATTVIIASDVELDLTRFVGRKIYYTTTNDAIKNTDDLFNRAKKDAKEYDGDIKSLSQKTNIFTGFVNTLIKSFKSSFGIPWTYLSITATLLAIVSLIAFSIYGQSWTNNAQSKNENLFRLQSIAAFALSLAMPLTAMNIAKKATSSNEAGYLVFVSSLLLNIPLTVSSYSAITGFNEHVLSTSIFFKWNISELNNHRLHGSNIIGTLIVTFITIIMFNNINNFKKYIFNKNTKGFSVLKQGISPWITTTLPSAILLFCFVYLLGSPLSYVSSKITYGLIDYPSKHWYLRLIIGFVIGCLIAWDLGNTINKITIISLIGMAQYDLRFASLIAIGIPLGSIGLGTTYFFGKNSFINNDDKKEASLSFRRGLNGMSEGPLNLKLKYGWKVHLPNIISTGIATGLALVLGIYILKAGHLGMLFFGAQAHLAQVNDISFLNEILPRGDGILTVFSSIAYGMVSYYAIMAIGSFVYLGISNVTFRIGKKKIIQ